MPCCVGCGSPITARTGDPSKDLNPGPTVFIDKPDMVDALFIVFMIACPARNGGGNQ
jgi:hypothetical protein